MRVHLPTLLALTACVSTAAVAQDNRHVLIVTGLSGDAVFARRFQDAARQIHDSALTRWGVPDSNLTWLAENPATDARRIRGKATRESIDASIARVAARARSGDDVLFVLVGHGSGNGEDSKISLPGADPTARDYAGWLDRLGAQRVTVVIAASASGDFVPVLSKQGRVVIAATKSSTERNESLFAGFIAAGLTTDAADADKDGGTTVLEAYAFARQGVAQSYSSRNLMLTEHAHLDDNGDGAGTADPSQQGAGDGALARRVVLAPKGATPTDPRAVKLLAERSALESELDQLRGRKASTDSTAYQRELERLLLSIAERTRALRALQPAARP